VSLFFGRGAYLVDLAAVPHTAGENGSYRVKAESLMSLAHGNEDVELTASP
jgi:hypothetical protein